MWSVEGEGEGARVVPAIRLRPSARPRSYIQILEDFQQHGHGQATPSPSRTRFSTPAGDDASALGDARRLAPGLADGGVSDALLPAPLPLPRRASWRARLRITSDFIEMGRAEPCSL